MGTKQIIALAQLGSYVSDLKILFHLHFGEFWGAMCDTLLCQGLRKSYKDLFISSFEKKSKFLSVQEYIYKFIYA